MKKIILFLLFSLFVNFAYPKPSEYFFGLDILDLHSNLEKINENLCEEGPFKIGFSIYENTFKPGADQEPIDWDESGDPRITKLAELGEVIRQIDSIKKENTYELIEEIHQGNDKIVFQAINRETENPKAIILFLNKKSRQEYFNNETILLKGLNHENIATIEDINPKYFYIVQDLANCDLQEFLIQNSSKFKCTNFQITLLDILRQVALGISYLQFNRIIHRDLKPENILLFISKDGIVTAKITDFSYAIRILEEESCVIENVLYGTFFYIDPKILTTLLSRDKLVKYKFSSDIYSFGILFHDSFYFLYPDMEDSLNEEIEASDESSTNQSINVLHIEALVAGIRPQLPKQIFSNIQFKSTKDVNRLIEGCWSQKRSNRPTIIKVIKELEVIIKEFSDFNDFDIESYEFSSERSFKSCCGCAMF